MTTEEVEALVTRIADATKAYIAPLIARVAALEAQQSKSLADAYCGVHLMSKLYSRGQLVTYGGSLWLCLADSSARPGDDGSWKLIVKAGRDAREPSDVR